MEDTENDLPHNVSEQGDQASSEQSKDQSTKVKLVKKRNYRNMAVKAPKSKSRGRKRGRKPAIKVTNDMLLGPELGGITQVLTQIGVTAKKQSKSALAKSKDNNVAQAPGIKPKRAPGRPRGRSKKNKNNLTTSVSVTSVTAKNRTARSHSMKARSASAKPRKPSVKARPHPAKTMTKKGNEQKGERVNSEVEEYVKEYITNGITEFLKKLCSNVQFKKGISCRVNISSKKKN